VVVRDGDFLCLMKIEDIKIDPELRDFLLPLSDEEEKQLRGSLMVEGCLSPLIVDSITGTLLDGHNRYRICTEKNIPFEIKEISMSRKERQKEFILINQLARRNLTPERMKYYRAMLYESVKGEAEFKAKGHEFKGNRHTKTKNLVRGSK
jgi:ParB-like chromosome segregation protein Spo0J